MATGTPIGTRIQRRRQALGMTQQELAGAIGVDRTAVSNWERGRHFPKRYLGRVEAVLGISLSEPEPWIPPGLQREVAALSPRQKEWMIRWLRDENPPPPGDEAAQAPGG